MAKQHQSSGVHFRTIDGTDNNGTFNVANSDFTRSTPANFADGISTLVEGPNPRMISNVVVGEGDAAVPNPEGLSAFMYSWGQFIDHDLDLSTTDRVNHIDVQGSDGTLNIITRATIDPNTGAGTNSPATAINTITGWLDASMVYGSNATVAASLRLPDGHMKSVDGNLPTTPDGTQFLAGDVRAQENPGLTALQTLFLREHNYQVDQLAHNHHDWTGDQLYDQARAIVGAEIAQITYGEFLPHLLGPDAVAPYKGFDPHVDPRITEEFAGAAFRFGHSIVSGDTEQIDNNGESITGPLELRDVFFQPPNEFNSGAGADGFLRHLASDPSQAMDARIVEDSAQLLDRLTGCDGPGGDQHPARPRPGVEHAQRHS
jgi:peroxidase